MTEDCPGREISGILSTDKERHMKRSITLTVAIVTLALSVLALARVSPPPQAVLEETISGTISATRVLTQNTRLTGDVTCTVTGAPCIVILAPDVKLKLNGFTITGQGDSSTGCQGTNTANENGISVNNQTDVTIEGPGLVQRFRAIGILLANNSSRVRVAQVTVSTNCMSGILLNASSDNLIEANVSVRNGNLSAPCGGI
jgi:hypothetical protein